MDVSARACLMLLLTPRQPSAPLRRPEELAYSTPIGWGVGDGGGCSADCRQIIILRQETEICGPSRRPIRPGT